MAGSGGGGGGDPYFSSVVSLLHFDGADGSTTFTDVTGKTFTATGNAQIDTAQSVFGGASLLLDGTTDWVETAEHADFGFGTGDFTIEGWIKTTAKNRVFAEFRPSSEPLPPVLFTKASTGYFGLYTGAGGGVEINGTSDVCDGAWHHVAITRASGTARLFVGGVLETTLAMSGDMDSTGICRIGAENGGNLGWDGHIDDFRVTKGVARYTATFTPPAAAFPDS